MKLIVQCPHCGGIQATTSRKVKICVYCGHSFQIVTKKGTRIVRVEK
jgi:Zn finger protein HypA/HybF involved in hydrogenase expression